MIKIRSPIYNRPVPLSLSEYPYSYKLVFNRFVELENIKVCGEKFNNLKHKVKIEDLLRKITAA